MKSHFSFRCILGFVGMIIDLMAFPIFQDDERGIDLPKPFYLKEDKFDVRLLNLNLASNDVEEFLSLEEKLVLADRDVICIKNINNAAAEYFYNRLLEQYDHFIFLSSEESFSMLIVSKYCLEEIPFICVSDEINSELFGFVINNHQKTLEYISITNLGLSRQKSYFGNILVKSSQSDRDTKGGAECKAGAKCEWGKDGAKWSFFGSGEIYDGHGNFVEGRIEQNSEGEGFVEIQGGNRKDEET